jgi:hypothetical protein
MSRSTETKARTRSEPRIDLYAIAEECRVPVNAEGDDALATQLTGSRGKPEVSEISMTDGYLNGEIRCKPFVHAANAFPRQRPWVEPGRILAGAFSSIPEGAGRLGLLEGRRGQRREVAFKLNPSLSGQTLVL